MSLLVVGLRLYDGVLNAMFLQSAGKSGHYKRYRDLIRIQFGAVRSGIGVVSVIFVPDCWFLVRLDDIILSVSTSPPRGNHG